MNKTLKLFMGAALATAISATAGAKTLVYCSEGSPEGFNPAFYTSGTTFDATSRQIFNRLVEFKPGTTELAPALAESWNISADGLVYTFKKKKGHFLFSGMFFVP